MTLNIMFSFDYSLDDIITVVLHFMGKLILLHQYQNPRPSPLLTPQWLLISFVIQGQNFDYVFHMLRLVL